MGYFIVGCWAGSEYNTTLALVLFNYLCWSSDERETPVSVLEDSRVFLGEEKWLCWCLAFTEFPAKDSVCPEVGELPTNDLVSTSAHCKMSF